MDKQTREFLAAYLAEYPDAIWAPVQVYPGVIAFYNSKNPLQFFIMEIKEEDVNFGSRISNN